MKNSKRPQDDLQPGTNLTLVTFPQEKRPTGSLEELFPDEQR